MSETNADDFEAEVRNCIMVAARSGVLNRKAVEWFDERMVLCRALDDGTYDKMVLDQFFALAKDTRRRQKKRKPYKPMGINLP